MSTVDADHALWRTYGAVADIGLFLSVSHRVLTYFVDTEALTQA